MDYPLSHFSIYAYWVYNEMIKRGYNCSALKFKIHLPLGTGIYCTYDDLFRYWHNDRYLTQCYYNLQEKYDCGGISKNDWELIERRYAELCQD